MLEKGVRSAMALLVGAWVIRYLGPEKYGQLSYVVAFIAFFQAIVSLGIEGVLIRELISSEAGKKYFFKKSRSKEGLGASELPENSVLISSVFVARLSSGCVLLLMSIGAIGVLNNFDADYMLLTALVGGTLIFQAADVFDLWNQSQLNSRITVIVKIFAYLCSNGLRICLIELDQGLLWFGVAVFLEGFIIAAFLFGTYLYKNIWVFNLNYFKNIIDKMVRETWPLIVASFLAVVYSRFDQIALEYYLGKKDLGLYSAAVIFATATYFMPGILCASVMPVLTKAKIVSRYSYIQTLRTTYIFLISASILVAGITFLLADLIVSIFLGQEYHQAIIALQIYSFTNIPVYLGVAHGLWIVNEKKLKISLYKAIAGAVVSIGLCLIIVPIYGIAGAAISTLIALIVSDVIAPIMLNRRLFKELIDLKNNPT